MARATENETPDDNAAKTAETAALQQELADTKARLQDAELRLARAVAAPQSVGFWRLEVADNTLYGDAPLARLFGLSPDDVAGGVHVSRYFERIHPDDQGSIAEAMTAMPQASLPFSAEYRTLNDDGAYRYVAVEGVSEAEDGRIVRVCGTAYDIHERRRREDEQRRRADEMQTILDTVAIGIVIAHDPEARQVTMNRQAAEMMRSPLAANAPLPSAEIVAALPMRVYRDGREVPFEERLMLRAARGETVRDAETEFVFADGARRTVIANAAPLRDADGTPRGAVAAWMDVTARNEAAEALRQSEERFRLAAEAANGIVYEWRADTDAVWRSSGLYDLLGFRPDEVPATRQWWLERVHPDDLARLRGEWESSLARGHRAGIAEYRIRHRDGRWVYVQDKAQQVWDEAGVIVRVVGNTTDITERKAQEEALRESELRHRLLTEDAAVIVWRSRPDGRLDAPSPSWERFTGQPASEYMGDATGRVMVHPDDVTAMMASWKAAQTAKTRWEYGYRLWHQPTRMYRYVEVNAVPIFADGGDITGYVGMVRDVHERQEARLTQERLAALVTQTQEAIISTDAQGVVLSWNRGAERLYGWTEDEMRGQSMARVYPPETASEWDSVKGRLERGEAIYDYESPRVRRSGERFTASMTMTPFLNADGTLHSVSGIVRDVTAQKAAEAERLRHLIEVESLNRRLQRAMQETHHRVKNNLQVIAAVTEMEATASDGAAQSSALRRIQQHVRTLATVHDLLTQQAKDAADAEFIPIREALDRLLPALEATSGGREMRAEIADIALPAKELTALMLVVSEAVSNAVKHSDGPIAVTIARSDGMATAEVRDSGDGFPPDFDPERDANTGVELLMNTARWDLGGDILFDNPPDGGACVRVRFPLPRTPG